MIKIGTYQLLTVVREADHGIYLEDNEENDVLLPQKWVPEGTREGDVLELFVYNDHEQRPIATTLEPKITLNSFAYLKVRTVEPVGAFMEWGMEKDLLVPFAQQARKMQEGESYLVYMYLDEQTDRLVASSKVHKFAEKKEIDLKEDQEVELLVGQGTDLGVTVIINNTYKGLLYHNEIFQRIHPGDIVTGYIKQVRDDNHIDVTLHKPGYLHIGPNADQIMAVLQANNGFLDLTDKSDPDDIKTRLQMSKKTFKRALGALYKQKVVRLEKDGVYLENPTSPTPEGS